jgi:quercetin dioxygenase-like cupin family protein
MSDYSILNLKEIEDSAPGFGYGDVHEARFATKPLGAEQTGLAYYAIKPDQEQPFAHRHASQEELYVLISGSATAYLDDERRALTELDAVRVGPGVTRHFAAGPEGAVMLAFGAPAVSDHKNDAELLQLDDVAAG